MDKRKIPLLVIVLFLFLFLLVKRPAYLSLGTIEFAFGVVFVFISSIFVFTCLKYRNDPLDVHLLDILYGIIVIMTVLSFFVFSKQLLMIHHVFTVFAVFILYLLVRVSYTRHIFHRRKLLVSFFVIIAVVEALLGIMQFLSRSEMRGHFFNVNYFAMYIALNIPLALVLLWERKRRLPDLILLYLVLGILGFVVLLSQCRTAYASLVITLLLMVSVRYQDRLKPVLQRSSVYFRCVWGAVSVVFLSLIAALFFFLKPLSTVGRLLVWRISWNIFSDNPIFGIGYANFPSIYNLYQGRFFDRGMGTEMERLSAFFIPYAYNDYIESAVVFGIIGLIPLAVFWFLILKKVKSAFRKEHDLNLGMAGVILLYMIMAFFYSPGQILPMQLLFAVCLACVVSRNLKGGIKIELKNKHLLSVSVLSFFTAVALFPTFYKQFRGEQDWSRARILCREGHDYDALKIYERVYPSLKWDGFFVHQHGKLLSDTGYTAKAIHCFEQGKEFWPNPYLLEDLAIAYERCGNLDQAIKNASLASNILPWRLTSMSLLMDFYYKKKDILNSAKYTQVLLDTPMKIRTSEGEKLKEKAKIHKEKIERSFDSSQTPQEKTVSLLPEGYRCDVSNALVKAGNNSEQLIKAIVDLDQEERECIAFLLANMPLADLQSLTADFLVSNVKYAIKARQELPYNQGIPEEVFLNYVLPYSNVNEQRDNWRADFYNRFIETARTNSTVEETAVDLNAQIYREFTLEFMVSDFRKLIYSPYESIEKGSVSCAESALMLVNACRAVGIPARMIFIPYWTHSAGGHVWLEVYDKEQWHYMSSFDPSRFDETWFAEYASKTDTSKPEHRIYAPSFKRTEIHVLYGPDVSFTDITDRYVTLAKEP
ncbi:MAG: O-antigen ligase family protein [Candidatus Aminicenantes bacterium]|nr:O-antigen ligase family protein [Candidatus Aminicenantes bacterium]